MISCRCVKTSMMNTFARLFRHHLLSIPVCGALRLNDFHISKPILKPTILLFFLLWCSFSMLFYNFPFLVFIYGNQCLIAMLSVGTHRIDFASLPNIFWIVYSKRIYKRFAFDSDLWITEHFSYVNCSGLSSATTSTYTQHSTQSLNMNPFDTINSVSSRKS